MSDFYDYSLGAYIRRNVRVRRRPEGWQPRPDDVAINAVIDEFPDFGVDEIVAEVGRRGFTVSAELADAWLGAASR
jgi:hypothetical protein